MSSWTQIDGGDLDQGFLLYMLHLRARLGRYMTRDSAHQARHYVRGREGKPYQRTLAILSPTFTGAPGCSWDNLKRLAFLRGFHPGASEQRHFAPSACSRRYRRVAEALGARLNASACCGVLGERAPRGTFGHDVVDVW